MEMNNLENTFIAFKTKKRGVFLYIQNTLNQILKSSNFEVLLHTQDGTEGTSVIPVKTTLGF